MTRVRLRLRQRQLSAINHDRLTLYIDNLQYFVIRIGQRSNWEVIDRNGVTARNNFYNRVIAHCDVSSCWPETAAHFIEQGKAVDTALCCGLTDTPLCCNLR